MGDLVVEIMLEDHSHLFTVEVDNVLEAEQLKDTRMKCGVCGYEGNVARVGTPGRKPRGERKTAPPGQSSIFKE